MAKEIEVPAIIIKILKKEEWALQLRFDTSWSACWRASLFNYHKSEIYPCHGDTPEDALYRLALLIEEQSV
jgi:uncharacterized protein YjlB